LIALGGYYAGVVARQAEGFLKEGGRSYSSSKAVNGGTLVSQNPASPPC
jgi:hypothetical protein